MAQPKNRGNPEPSQNAGSTRQDDAGCHSPAVVRMTERTREESTGATMLSDTSSRSMYKWGHNYNFQLAGGSRSKSMFNFQKFCSEPVLLGFRTELVGKAECGVLFSGVCFQAAKLFRTFAYSFACSWCFFPSCTIATCTFVLV